MKKPQNQSKPELTIVILNFNTKELLKQCLSSVGWKNNYQIIVVDNASTDTSVGMVKEKFPWVEVIESKKNLGFTRGNNLAREKVRGEYVLFLNSDTKVEHNTLEVMVSYMKSDPKIGISTCLTLLPNGKLYYACNRGFPTPWNSFCYFSGLAKLFPRSRFFAGYTATYLPINEIHEIDACSGTFLLIQKKILDQVGWFDEDYFAYGEDIDMCFRVKELGFKVMFNPEVRITHYWGASSGLKSTSKGVSTASDEITIKWNKARYEAMRIFYDKHYSRKYPAIFNFIVHLGIRAAMYIRSNVD